MQIFKTFIYSSQPHIQCALTQNENFTLILFQNLFVSIHVVVRFTYDYRDFIADNDFQFPGLFKCQSLKPHSLRRTCSGTGGFALAHMSL